MSDINPRVDIAFKKIFGVEENKDLLISLINSIVSQEDQVADVILLNPYNPKSFMSDKLSILDIKAKGIDGKKFNIEMQISDEADYDKRALYYWAKLYTEQLKASEDYSRLSKAIGIHILNFTSIIESKKYHNVFHIKEKDSGTPYFKDLELHTLELKKFANNNQEKFSDIVSKITNSLDMWLAFLTRHDLLKANNLPASLNDKNLKKAIEVLDIMNFNDCEREAYDDRLKWLRIEANTLKKHKQEGREEGMIEGIIAGRIEGRIEGIKEGREEGKMEEKTKIAKNLLSHGVTIDTISNVTGLSESEITKLI